MKKKKKNDILEGMTPSFGLGGVSLGSSLLGGAFESKLPSGVKNPLTTIGSTTSKFVSPMATLGVFNTVTKQMKKLKGGKK